MVQLLYNSGCRHNGKTFNNYNYEHFSSQEECLIDDQTTYLLKKSFKDQIAWVVLIGCQTGVRKYLVV